MRNKSFPFPMRRSELVAGWIYLPIHIFILPVILALSSVALLPLMGITLDDPHINLVYYAVSFTYVLAFLFRFLKSSFSDLVDNFLRSLSAIGLGFLLYFIANIAVNMVLLYFTENLTNPNSEIINSTTKLNANLMTAVSVFLAPVVEEVLFRGVVFGSLRKRNRFWAFAVSALLFAVYHLWDAFLGGFDWLLVLYLLQYIPAGLILAWCYERGRGIWAPIFLHMIINYVSVSVQLG